MQNDIYLDTFGIRLRRERERLGLTLAEFALNAAVSKSSQRLYEVDDRLPDVMYLPKVRAMGVDTEFIVFGRRPGLSDDQLRTIREVAVGVRAWAKGLAEAVSEEREAELLVALIRNEFADAESRTSEYFRQHLTQLSGKRVA